MIELIVDYQDGSQNIEALDLAKSTISYMSYYAMQMAKIPRTICDDVDKRVPRFIWGASEYKISIHLMS